MYRIQLLSGSIGNNASPVNAVLDLGGGSTQITFVPSVEVLKNSNVSLMSSNL